MRGEAIQGVNVKDANENEFPFAVALSLVNNGTNPIPPTVRVFCSGSLITRKHVLTAEHCIIKKHVNEVEILVGSVNLNLCKAYDPKKFMTYQQWKYKVSNKFPLYYHDVAVITVTTIVYFCMLIVKRQKASLISIRAHNFFRFKRSITNTILFRVIINDEHLNF